MHTCTYICIYVRMLDFLCCAFKCVYTCMTVCLWVITHACMYESMHVYRQASFHVLIYACARACMYGWMYVCMYVYMRPCMHAERERELTTVSFDNHHFSHLFWTEQFDLATLWNFHFPSHAFGMLSVLAYLNLSQWDAAHFKPSSPTPPPPPTPLPHTPRHFMCSWHVNLI